MLPLTPKTKAKLEIIPESHFLVFEGDVEACQPITLRGVLRLTTSDSINIKGVTLSLEATRKISWYNMSNTTDGMVKNKKTIACIEKNFGTTATHKTNKGVIEWNFEFVLPKSTLESIEGMRQTYLEWNLKAHIKRPTWNTKDLEAHEHIRIVRTLAQDLAQYPSARNNTDIWQNKVSYTVSIPTGHVVFGTSIVADLELCPLKKGIRMGDIELILLESVNKRIDAEDRLNRGTERTHNDEFEVAKTIIPFPEDKRVYVEDNDDEHQDLQDEGYVFKARLPLPRSLRVCRQDVDQWNISITHRLKVLVNIHNPEGHVSQLICRLPVSLFISPFLPIDSNNVVEETPNEVSDELNDSVTKHVAPPEYGSHLLDELYSDIRPSGMMSELPSTVATPSIGMSRSGSTDNLLRNMQALGNIANIPHGNLNSAELDAQLLELQHMNVNASADGHRLTAGMPTDQHISLATDLALRRTPPRTGNAVFGVGTPVSSFSTPRPTRSRPTSRELTVSSHQEIQQADYNMSTLSRVPSYNAAVRTPNTVDAAEPRPPTYTQAISRPASPHLGPVMSPEPSSPMPTLPLSPGIRVPHNLMPATLVTPSVDIVAPTPIPETAPDLFDGPTLYERRNGTTAATEMTATIQGSRF